MYQDRKSRAMLYAIPAVTLLTHTRKVTSTYSVTLKVNVFESTSFGNETSWKSGLLLIIKAIHTKIKQTLRYMLTRHALGKIVCYF